MSGSLDALLASATLWRARSGPEAGGAADRPYLPTGWPKLDAELPGRGWLSAR
jgi:hypothetical protein